MDTIKPHKISVNTITTSLNTFIFVLPFTSFRAVRFRVNVSLQTLHIEK